MLFAPRRRAKMSAVIISLAAAPAFAESPAPASQAPADAATTTITLNTIEIISQELNAARLQIQPSLGASTYTLSPEALATIPQGENAPLNQVLLQMPGVAQDSFGQVMRAPLCLGAERVAPRHHLGIDRVFAPLLVPGLLPLRPLAQAVSE
jgi:hypothetical protein